MQSGEGKHAYRRVAFLALTFFVWWATPNILTNLNVFGWLPSEAGLYLYFILPVLAAGTVQWLAVPYQLQQEDEVWDRYFFPSWKDYYLWTPENIRRHRRFVVWGIVFLWFFMTSASVLGFFLTN